MRYSLTTTFFKGQEGMIATYGDAAWEWFVDNIHHDYFHYSDMMRFPGFRHLTPKITARYARTILANVAAQPDSSIVRFGRLYAWRA